MADPVICRIDSSNSGVASLEDFGNCEQMDMGRIYGYSGRRNSREVSREPDEEEVQEEGQVETPAVESSLMS
ncbi:hypothetical protein RIF29_03465 [Crotalaria pallida]|uniref:Uncharacterized protein n=1 Tax=Crotalaria pallida TaxID=3830 RepID=A0AAN9J069_CROPI